MAARDSQIVDLLLGSQATIKRFEAALEAEKQASSIELRILRERNSILEKEVVRLQSLLKDAERAMLGPVLPHELILEIANILLDTHRYHTLGSLCRISRAVREDVTPLFFHTMICDQCWDLDWSRSGGPIAQPSHLLPLDKWSHTRFIIAADSNTLIDNRKTYFPNLELGMTVCNHDASDGTGYRGELAIARPVTRERLSEYLRLPVHWDLDGSQITYDVVPVNYIRQITIDAGASIIPYAAPKPTDSPICLVPGYTERRSLRIEINRTEPSTQQTVAQIFDMADPAFDPRHETQTPAVVFVIQDDMRAVEQIVQGLESILRRHRALGVFFQAAPPRQLENVVEGEQGLSSAFEAFRTMPQASIALPDVEAYSLPRAMFDFRGMMQACAPVYCRLWRAMQAYRSVDGVLPTDVLLLYVEVTYPNLAMDPEAEVLSFRGDIHVVEDEETGETGLEVRARCIDVKRTREVMLWRHTFRGTDLTL